MTRPAYEVRLYDASGVLQGILAGPAVRTLAYRRQANAPGRITVAIDADHALAGQVQDKWLVRVRRRETTGWRDELWGLVRDELWTWGAERGSLLTLGCPGIMSMLGWRIVNYPAGVQYQSYHAATAAGTIMGDIVHYNLGLAATTLNGRKRTGKITGLTVPLIGDMGATLTWYYHGANVLATLQELAAAGGVDFDLEVDLSGASPAYSFKRYTLLGTDRSATLVFSMALGNMAQPTYEVVRSGRKTVACIWGQGEGPDRDYLTVTGADYVAETNDFELYVDAKDVPSGGTAALQGRGEIRLEEAMARPAFGIKALQAPSLRYGIHYDLGDLVTAINPFNGQAKVVQIKAVTVSFEDGKETIEVEAETR